MEELIRKQDALNIKFKDGILVQEDGIYVRADKVVEKIKALPPVKPEQEIIHCKDCKQFRKPSSIVNADWGWCSGWPTPLTTFVKVDGFCHRAEKRGSESE